MPKRVVEIPVFGKSVAAYARTPEARTVVAFLVKRATSFPEAAPALPDCNLRVATSTSFGSHPALRLFYSVEEEAIFLIEIGPWDELEDSF